MKNYCFTLFPCFCFGVFDHGLFFKFFFSFVVQFCIFFCTCFRFGMFISVLGFAFLFSGSVFLFWVCGILFFCIDGTLRKEKHSLHCVFFYYL